MDSDPNLSVPAAACEGDTTVGKQNVEKQDNNARLHFWYAFLGGKDGDFISIPPSPSALATRAQAQISKTAA